MKKFLLFIAGVIIVGTAAHAATVCFPFQGCTGTSTTPILGNVLIGNSSGTYTVGRIVAGSNVTVSTSTPGQISISSTGGGGGGSTTTINGVSGPTFTFATTTDANVQLSISTSTGTLTFNPAWSGVLGATRGGTDNDEYVTGDMLYADGANHLARVAISGNDGDVLTVSSGVPTWLAPTGGGSASGTVGLIQYSNGSGGFDASSSFYWDSPNNRLFANGEVYIGGNATSTAFGVINASGSGINLIGQNADDLLSPEGDGIGVNLFGGNGGSTSGAGADISVTAGSAQAGDNRGGSVDIEAGFGSGSGANGNVSIYAPNNIEIQTDADNRFLVSPTGAGVSSNDADATAYFNAGNLTTNRTFAFPDETGTFALGTGSSGSIAIWSTTSTLAAASSSTLRTATGLSATAPLSYSSATGVFSCPTCGAGTLTGNGTSTWIPFYNTATQLISVSGLTFASSTGMFSAPSSTITNSTTTNHIVTTKLQIPTNQTLTKGGEISVNSSAAATSASTLKFHDGTAERVLNPEKCFAPSWVIENPTAIEDIPILVFNNTSTITKVRAVNKTTNDTVTFNLGYGPSRATATSSLFKTFTSAQAVTATTTISSVSINASSTPNNGDILRFFTTAASSTQFTLDVCYRENP